jgi:2-dehydro-3-deoxygalactonokinase
MSEEDVVLERVEARCGMQSVVNGDGDFEAALVAVIEPWLGRDRVIPVRICGMAGAKRGWQEVPYAAVPCSPKTPFQSVLTRRSDLSVFIRGGVKQGLPADVMRGEETQIAGLLAEMPGYEGLVCLPGTHTKWALVRAGEIQSFQTFMTGEVFALLCGQSVLRLTLGSEGWDEPAFLDGVSRSVGAPAGLFSECFRLRAEALLNGLEGALARSRLSGLLIGQELAAVRPETEVVIIGSDSLAGSYRVALRWMQVEARTLDVESAVVAGLGGGDFGFNGSQP